MSYAPATKLSYANGSEACVVLTEGNVMVTKCMNVECRLQMKLVDWLILSEGKEVKDFVPNDNGVEIVYDDDADSTGSQICSGELCGNAFRLYWKGIQEGRTHEEMVENHTETFHNCEDCNPVKQPCAPPDFCGEAHYVFKKGRTSTKSLREINDEEQAAFQACEVCHPKPVEGLTTPDASLSFPVGTKLRWSSSETDSYRVAVMTKTGLLVVKDFNSASDPTTTYPKQFFETPAIWYSSLPQNGSVEATVYKTAVEKKIEVSSSLSDIEKLKELIQRFKIKQDYYENPTAVENLASFERQMKLYHNLLAKITLYDDMKWPANRMRLTKRLMILVNRFNNYTLVVNAMTESQKNWRPASYVYARRNNRLWINVNGLEKFITIYKDKIAVEGSNMLYDSFDQIPDVNMVDGKPLLRARYRNRMVGPF